ncbi:MAG: hypothetical protein ACLQU2_32700 [Candidatus Binataceae bacterium]
MSQALGATTLALMQGIIFLALAPIARVALSLSAVAATIVIMALVAFALTNMGLIIAWRIDSTQGFHAIMNLILLPIWKAIATVSPTAAVRSPPYPGFSFEEAKITSTRDRGLQGDRDCTRWGGQTAANVVIYGDA